jgi:hypothetical protein
MQTKTERSQGAVAVQDLNTAVQNVAVPGTRWYCLFLGYYTQVSDSDLERLSRACGRFVNRVVLGDKRVFFEVDLSRAGMNLGALQFKIQSFAETWDLPHPLWQWGVGKTLAEAWVQTRWKSLTPDFLPIEALDDYLYPLSSPIVTSKKTGLGAATFTLLRCLGYSTLAQLGGEMPHDLLLARLAHALGDELVQAEVSDPNGLLLDNWLAKLTADSLNDQPLETEPFAHPVGRRPARPSELFAA